MMRFEFLPNIYFLPPVEVLIGIHVMHYVLIKRFVHNIIGSQ